MYYWIVFFALPGAVFAEMQNHYILGTHGVSSAVKPERGYNYANIYTFYRAKQLNNQKGEKIPLGGKKSLEVHYLQNIFGYYSPYKIFGASWGMQIDIPCSTAAVDQVFFARSFEGVGKKLKLSDIYTEPFNIRWNWGRLYFFWAYGVYAPTGRYHHHFSKKNTGLGDWGQLITGAFTLFFDQQKTFSISAYSNYEIHSKKRGIDFRAGDNFCLDWGIGKTFDKVLTIGAVGYYERQPHLDRGHDVPKSARKVRDKVLSAGPELDLFVPQMGGHLTARYEVEFEAISRTKGRTITVLANFNF